MKDELSDSTKEALINECASKFRDLADEDYIAARLLFRSWFHEQYILLGQQAVEKYLKSILLYNGIKLVKQQWKPQFWHGLEDLFQEVEKISHISGLDFLNKLDVRRYFLHTFDGAENIKYRVNGSTTSPQSLLYLDQFVYYFRWFCRYNFLHLADGQIKHRSTYNHYPYNNFWLLREIIRKKQNTTKYNNLIWKNPYWWKRKKPNIQISWKYSFKNPIFWGEKELEFISEYVFIPIKLKETFTKEFGKMYKKNH